MSSPDTNEMRRPSAFRISMAEVLRAPRFSTAIGWKKWFYWKSLYLTDFLSADCSASRPDSLAATATYESASVLTTVTSQTMYAYHFATGSMKARLAVCRLHKPVRSFLDGHRQSWGLARQYRSEHDAWQFGPVPFCRPCRDLPGHQPRHHNGSCVEHTSWRPTSCLPLRGQLRHRPTVHSFR